MKKYLIRLDDASPFMNKERWKSVEDILNKYSINPLVGIIPNNQDIQTIIEPEDRGFWEKARKWQEKGWSIALHGYNHCCESTNGGINPIHNRSEFAGLPYEKQVEKIRNGYQILLNNNINPSVFFAPSHTYDENTILSLKAASQIRTICDTFSRYPFKDKHDFIVVPCQMGKFRNIPLSGYWTFCFHPNIMTNKDLYLFKTFIISNLDKFIDFSSLPLHEIRNKSILDKTLSTSYYFLRKIKRRSENITYHKFS